MNKNKIKRIKKKKKAKKISSPIKRKVLILLQAGLALAMTPSPKRHFYIFKELAEEWENVDRQYLYRIVREFYKERLVDWEEKKDGSVKIILTEEGKERAIQYNIGEMKIERPAEWDGRWRVVLFDIPENRRAARDALRNKIKYLGFFEMQKSVFVYPFPCKDEIDFIVEFFEIRSYVRYAEIMNLTNEAELKLEFGLK